MPRRRKARAAAGLVALAVAGSLGLSACGGDDAGAANQLTWYINPDAGGNDPSGGGQAELAAKCTEASGGEYRISVQQLPNSASDQRQQLLRRLAAGDRGVDIMSLDPVYVAEFAQAGFLAEVPQERQAEFQDDAVQPIIDSAMWDDTMYAAPMWANTQLLWYRKSVAEAAGLDMSQPVTWDQIIEAASSQNKTIGVQANRYEGYAVWINALVEGGGGKIIENEGAQSVDEIQWGLDSEAGREAARIIREVSNTGTGGPAMGSSDETASLDQFLGPNSGFMLNWPYVWAAVGERNPGILDDVAFTRYPQTTEGEESRPPLGGIELGVNVNSDGQEYAWDAIKCITSEENQKAYMLGTGNPAARMAVYDDPEIREEFPMADEIRSSLDGGAPRPVSQFYGDISGALQREFSPPSQVTEQTPADAQNLIQRVLSGEAIL
ncbi:MAG: extracellular solute-binding protein [Mobilicoccus sp.]|nr:extracellular solute-binding protein [Mobilicoccus sp.]